DQPTPASSVRRLESARETWTAGPRSERQVVVFVVECFRKVLEFAFLAAGWGLGLGRRRARTTFPITRRRARSSPAAAAEHDQLAHVDLGAVARLAFLVRPLPILDAPFHVELVALVDVTLDDVGQLLALAVPGHASVPFGFLLLRSGGVVPGAAGGERESGDAVPARRRLHLG